MNTKKILIGGMAVAFLCVFFAAVVHHMWPGPRISGNFSPPIQNPD
jgi:hypothetical protein